MYYVSFILNLFLLYITRGLNWKTIFSLGEAEGTFMPVSEFCPCHNKYYNGGHTKEGYVCVCVRVYRCTHGYMVTKLDQVSRQKMEASLIYKVVCKLFPQRH